MVRAVKPALLLKRGPEPSFPPNLYGQNLRPISDVSVFAYGELARDWTNGEFPSFVCSSL